MHFLDPNEVPEYAFTTFEYFRARESMAPIQPYMANQSEVNEKMRQVLVDWLVEVHLEIRFLKFFRLSIDLHMRFFVIRYQKFSINQ